MPTINEKPRQILIAVLLGALGTYDLVLHLNF